MQKNISDNLNNWDYISNYSTWMYRQYGGYGIPALKKREANNEINNTNSLL